MHPAVCFLYLLAVLGFTAFAREPVTVLISLGGSVLLAALSGGLKGAGWFGAVAVTGALANFLFVHNGETALFSSATGRSRWRRSATGRSSGECWRRSACGEPALCGSSQAISTSGSSAGYFLPPGWCCPALYGSCRCLSAPPGSSPQFRTCRAFADGCVHFLPPWDILRNARWIPRCR